MIVFSYFLYYFILIPVSLLPFRILYLLSDFLYLILFHLVGYRMKVIRQNIARSFPFKSEKEQRQLASAFYRHLCDLVVESIKIFTISEKQVLKRMICANPEVVNRYFDAGRSVIIAGGHYNNWELFAVAIHKFIRHRAVGIYKPLANRFFDRKMRSTRGKFGLELLSTRDVREFFERNREERTAVIFAIDQSPGSKKNAYWTTFLNQDTAVQFGAEKYAGQYNYPVVFGRLIKTSRGHYQLSFEEITSDPSAQPYGFITETGTRLLEADINKDPPYWLWSHRRWKHKKDE